MSFKRNKLRDAISIALCVSATTLMSSASAFAQDTAATTDEAKELETIQVTGSRIRRVDSETASPVLAIDRAAIEKSGKLTLGDLIQELPNIAGAPTNPQVNNGGGTGISAIELRGLNSQRTLVLINGRRAINGTGVGADINAIPASAVERIEVLSSGASAVYGSDAVAGVVNFILRTDYQGMEASVDTGISSRGDGFRRGASFTWGQTTDRGNVTAGVNYNKFDKILAGNREFSKDAVYLYYGYVFAGGSSRIPSGRASLPAGFLQDTNGDGIGDTPFGCGNVMRIPGQPGTTTGDYRCYTAADAYNYQPENLILTPQERFNAFALGNYAITDKLTAFVELYQNNTTSQFNIAPLPFDTTSDGVLISADNIYNPFGIDFGDNGTTAFLYRTRFNALGQRLGAYKTSTQQGILGVKGVFGDTWQWDVAYNYGHYSQITKSRGYVYYQGLVNALGPSFIDPVTGDPTCGTLAAPIANCTPLNIFNLEDPNAVAVLQQNVVTPIYNDTYIMRSYEANANGEIFDLPAGAANLAVGLSHRSEYDHYDVDFVAITTGEDGTCFISQEACSTPQRGGYNVGEAYAEMFLPLLKDAPFAKSLNVILGSRYSDYSNFGDTVNSKLAVEWKPIEDLLVRGTVSEVFRAPTINDIFAGAAGNAPNFDDKCVGYGADPDLVVDPITGAVISDGPLTPADDPRFAAEANACGAPTGATNIPLTGITASGNSQTTGVLSGAAVAGYDLQPEEGKSFNFGFVWDPGFLPGFSAAVDYWRIYLNQAITQLDAQQVLGICLQDQAHPFCNFIHRSVDGQVAFIQQPTVNIGRYDVKGVDLSLKYRMPETSWGKFSFGLDATRLLQFDVNTNPDDPTTNVTNLLGTYNRSYGNYPAWRALFSVAWTMGDWNVGLKTRYIGKSQVGRFEDEISADPRCDFNNPTETNPGGTPFCVVLPISSQVTTNLSAGYNFSAINSRVDFGIDNVTDKQPPLLYQNNVINANTDVNTYDTIGRYYWAKFTVKW
jgi:outer membrane receptor protein involved in Fe transport